MKWCWKISLCTCWIILVTLPFLVFSVFSDQSLYAKRASDFALRTGVFMALLLESVMTYFFLFFLGSIEEYLVEHHVVNEQAISTMVVALTFIGSGSVLGLFAIDLFL